MKILVVSEIFPPKHGGSGRWMWELYSRLPPGTVYVAAHNWPESDRFDRAHALPVDRIDMMFQDWGAGIIKPRGMRVYLRAARDLWRVIRKTKPTVLHCGRCVPEGFLAWMLGKLGGPPYWCYVHGEELTSCQSSRELRWMARRGLNGAEHLIANSQNTREILLEDWKVPATKVTVMHPGVDSTAFTPAERSIAVRNKLGWGDRPVVLTVGVLSERKGQDMMIRALPAIRLAIPDVLYAVAGEGRDRPRLEQLAADLGVTDAVQFRGAPNDQDLINCYQQCDLFTLPNRRAGCDIEGFGIVLLEAQSCGKPVIAGTSGGTAETMKIPETGTVTDCTIPDRLGEIVVEWLQDSSRRDRIGEAARRWIVERFDWSILTEQASRLFKLDNTDSTRGDSSALV